MSGSPPHTRGKVGPLLGGYLLPGITPAYAGKSRCYVPLCHISWDHPRIRGEKAHRAGSACLSSGSPPHTRGKGGYVLRRRVRHGITPAYAGKSGMNPSLLLLRRDHPRIRGEKSSSPAKMILLPGSPPHTRGKERNDVICLATPRITPAYAGKRRRRR